MTYYTVYTQEILYINHTFSLPTSKEHTQYSIDIYIRYRICTIYYLSLGTIDIVYTHTLHGVYAFTHNILTLYKHTNMLIP